MAGLVNLVNVLCTLLAKGLTEIVMYNVGSHNFGQTKN